MSQFLSESSEWTFDLIERYDNAIAQVAADYKLDTYPNQFEMISAEQMMDAYATVGMPLGYAHWSFGKRFLGVEQRYKRGQMGLAYEIVINSSPCISYLMEENTMTMQALVMAHAGYGHNSFFKNNYLFRAWTSAESIIDYLLFAKNYVAECEKRYGEEDVALVLDSCHAVMDYGVDSYKRPPRLSAAKERARQEEREKYRQAQVNELWRTLPKGRTEERRKEDAMFPPEPQENLLYFIEKHSPILQPWQREIVRIVRKLAQYFYPQRQTKVMNEGWACFWHYTILNQLYEKGLLTDGSMIEFLQAHTNVLYQPSFDSPHYSGLNPYTLGFAMMSDIRRICEEPTDEDRHWFAEIAGSDWLMALDFAMRNFKDESFILQYLSPKLIRDLKLFSVLDDDQRNALEITAIHDEHGYRQLRKALAEQYNLGNLQPNIQVYKADRRGDRSLTLRHTLHGRRPLDNSADEVLKHLGRLWGFDVRMEDVNVEGLVEHTRECEVEPTDR